MPAINQTWKERVKAVEAAGRAKRRDAVRQGQHAAGTVLKIQVVGGAGQPDCIAESNVHQDGKATIVNAAAKLGRIAAERVVRQRDGAAAAVGEPAAKRG